MRIAKIALDSIFKSKGKLLSRLKRAFKITKMLFSFFAFLRLPHTLLFANESVNAQDYLQIITDYFHPRTE